MNLIYKFLCFIVLGMLISCGKGGDDSPNGNQTDNTPTLTKSSALLPENGDVCTDFSEIINDQENIKVIFKWSAVPSATAYVLTIFESTTEVYTTTITSTETEVAIGKGKSYTWQIEATNANIESTSDTFSFTTPGDVTSNYVPYAAEITMTFDYNSNNLTVNWQGNDQDGDNLSYDLIIKEGEVELVNITNTLETTYGPIDTVIGSEYTVEVHSKDGSGNASVSIQTRIM
ncbi:hypothetical protein QSV08_05040 [Maribacter sp. BPC-D8]|uniref:hypothetical protein n=1 Tax=Maribacter sp. BPC-D8 TaxID=3053613 RepID=UPI002B462DF0|nr:hypothetical protein [Maribacter sp. BPC-D8]WRI30607.1 hypothetical protein QSV08_05040 [Maribacter sp. BPC-D8]